MRERIIDKLRQIADESDEGRKRWLALRDRVGDIAISTIDAFCYALLREFPLEAGLSPGFTVADETESARLAEDAIDRAMAKCRAIAASDPAVALVLTRITPPRLRVALAHLVDRRLVARSGLRRYIGREAALTPEALTARAVARFRDALQALPGGLPAFLAEGPRAHPRFGLIDLHAALIAAALAELHQDPAGSESLVESAWRLTASLRGQPTTAARLNALAQDRRTLGALRASRTRSSEWPARLRDLGSPEYVLGAQSVTALSFLEDARGPRTTVRGAFLETNEPFALLGEKGPGALGSLFLAANGGAVRSNSLMEAVDAERARAREASYRWLQGPIEKPYLRLCAADYATALAAECARTLANADRCAAVPETGPRGQTLRLAPWNIVGDGAISLDRLARRSAVLGVEAELTALVLEARAGAEGGSLPESRVCAGRRWVVERRPAGDTAIHLDNNPFGDREATVAYRLEER
jgi:hypothetical protein